MINRDAISSISIAKKIRGDPINGHLGGGQISISGVIFGRNLGI